SALQPELKTHFLFKKPGTAELTQLHKELRVSYLSLSRLQISPPRQASSSMYTYLLSLNVRCRG
ncbi:hypothetical protein INR49_026875, partial [Caranx melampygus]